ncbi:tRNA (pseudouridine(54)-N(1))-methyltransferase TrmY [Candidatus Woesearchaeota archaeon]|nr:tRNA (pseudouridine(54)-N(1))-methyltransferase TrmY [Candidatus Woesearchaeota archaeon]
MRHFLILSRSGQTSSNFTSLREAGRLDLVAQCLTSSIFISHKTRKDVIVHIILTGPPNPPIYLRVESSKLYDIRTDEDSWKEILKNVLDNKQHPGFTIFKKSFQEVIKELSKEVSQIYILEEKGINISKEEIKENVLFILGDHIGLPKKDENFALRYGKKLSLGKTKYLAKSCITIINYILDQK